MICSNFGGPVSMVTFQRLYGTFPLQDCFAIGLGSHNLFSITCVCCTGCCGLSFQLCTRRTTWEDSSYLGKHGDMLGNDGSGFHRSTEGLKGPKIFYFHPDPWGNDYDLISPIFFNWVVQLPSRLGFQKMTPN